MNDIINKEDLSEAIVEIRKKKLKKKVIFASLIVVGVAIVLGISWLYGHNYAKNQAAATIAELNQRIYDLENTPVVVDPVTPEIVQKVLSDSMADISELATAEYIFTNAARFTDTAHIIKIFDWMTEKSFVQKWDGKIKAGVDLEKLHIAIKEKTITITMPYADILSYEIDYSSVEVLDEKNNIFNPISVNDKVNFDRETKYSMEARAVENGLLVRAQENAKNTLINLLTTSIENIQDYKIEFQVIDNA